MQKRSSIHRRIYKQYYKSIPVDEFGRSYDIHHKDGDHTNNSIENLIAIPIQEHYNIHYNNQDYSACVLIGLRMKLSAEEISNLNSLAAIKRVESGNHHWTTKEHATKVKKRIQDAVKAGTYHMLGGRIQKEFQKKRSQQGVHQWNGSVSNQKMLDNGIHPSQKKFICPHCGKQGKGSTNAKRWHFDNCKDKRQ